MFETSLNAPGFSISPANLSEAAAESETATGDLLELLDLPTTAVPWPNREGARVHQNGTSSVKGANELHEVRNPVIRSQPTVGREIKMDPSLLDRAVRNGCEAAIASEPKLTQWDLVMGDGDCGEAVRGVCEG